MTDDEEGVHLAKQCLLAMPRMALKTKRWAFLFISFFGGGVPADQTTGTWPDFAQTRRKVPIRIPQWNRTIPKSEMEISALIPTAVNPHAIGREPSASERRRPAL